MNQIHVLNFNLDEFIEYYFPFKNNKKYHDKTLIHLQILEERIYDKNTIYKRKQIKRNILSI